MPYPEPSRADHDAPWNQQDFINEDGEEDTRCGCTSCQRRHVEEAREESGYYDDLYEQAKDRRLGLC